MNRKALGKGINALIPDFENGVPESDENGSAKNGNQCSYRNEQQLKGSKKKLFCNHHSSIISREILLKFLHSKNVLLWSHRARFSIYFCGARYLGSAKEISRHSEEMNKSFSMLAGKRIWEQSSCLDHIDS